MGCGAAKEKLEDEMTLMKLERLEIKMERETELKKLAELEGCPIQKPIVPDYIDPKFAEEKKIYEDEEWDLIEDNKTEAAAQQKKKAGDKNSKSKKNPKEKAKDKKKANKSKDKKGKDKGKKNDKKKKK